jgi:hypothetical protein
MKNKKNVKVEKGGKKKSANGFQQVVESTSDISNAYRSGLQALKKEHRQKIQLADTSFCEGSVDIDAAVLQTYPQDNRWDYCFSYKTEVFFAEVHSAHTGEVDVVLRKLQWLIDWLNTKAPQLNVLKAKSKHPYYWIQSNGFHILPGSAQFRRVIQEKIKPIAKLKLG